VQLEVRSEELSHADQIILRSALRCAGELSQEKAHEVLLTMLPSLLKLPDVNYHPLRVSFQLFLILNVESF
jgi:hypothetical protein